MRIWTEAPLSENLAAELGIELSSIDQSCRRRNLKAKEGLRNQARLGVPLIRENVEKMAQALRHGGKMPAIFKTPDGSVLAGNHRIAAVELLDWATIGAYTATPPEVDPAFALEQFKRRDNISNGVPPPEEERLEQAVYFAFEHDQRPVDLQRQFCLKYRQVAQAIRAETAKRFLRKNRIDLSWNRVLFDALQGIKDEKIMLAIARFAREYELNVAGAQDLIRAVKNKRTASSRLGVIERWGHDIDRARSAAGSTQPQKKRTWRQQAADRLRKEIVKPAGFRDFILTGNRASNGGPFTCLADFGITDAGEIAALVKELTDLQRQIGVICGGGKGKRRRAAKKGR